MSGQTGGVEVFSHCFTQTSFLQLAPWGSTREISSARLALLRAQKVALQALVTKSHCDKSPRRRVSNWSQIHPSAGT